MSRKYYNNYSNRNIHNQNWTVLNDDVSPKAVPFCVTEEEQKNLNLAKIRLARKERAIKKNRKISGKEQHKKEVESKQIRILERQKLRKLRREFHEQNKLYYSGLSNSRGSFSQKEQSVSDPSLSCACETTAQHSSNPIPQNRGLK